MEDFCSHLPKFVSEGFNESKIDAFKHLIDSWLETDKSVPHKQRYTAKRIFRRLQKEALDFDCSYRLVTMYVSLQKKELHLDKKGWKYSFRASFWGKSN